MAQCPKNGTGFIAVWLDMPVVLRIWLGLATASPGHELNLRGSNANDHSQRLGCVTLHGRNKLAVARVCVRPNIVSFQGAIFLGRIVRLRGESRNVGQNTSLVVAASIPPQASHRQSQTWSPAFSGWTARKH